MSDSRPERRLAAILATDVAGYSRLMGSNEEATLARLNTLNRGVIEPTIEEFRGRIVKTMGDGLLAEFASAVDAVRAAVKIQRGTRSFNADIPEPEQLRLRIGVNIGDLIYQGSDVFGDGVNIAARLQSIAELDGIFVSQTVRDYVREEASFIFDDLGARSLKNIDRPVRIFRVRQTGDGPAPRARGRARTWTLALGSIAIAAVLVGGFAWWARHEPGPRGRMQPLVTASAPATPAPAPPSKLTASAPAQQTAALPALTAPAQPSAPAPAGALAIPAEPRFSIVVLPLRNLSGEPKDRYFPDAVADRLTTALGRLPGGLVIARETGFLYRGRAAEAKAIAAELGVRYLLEGAVTRESTQTRVQARLVDGQSGGTAWQGRFEKERIALPALESELVASLGAALGAAPEGVKQAAGAFSPVANADADDLAMEGWEAAYRPATIESTDEAEALFTKALAADANSREAKIGLAHTLLRGLVLRPVGDRRARVQRADEIVTPLLAGSPDLPLAHLMKAQVLLQSGQADRALQLIEEALALNPSLADAWGLLGTAENRLGREADSLPHLRQAIRLSPRDPLLSFWLTAIAAGEFAAGAEAPALEDLKKATTVNARFPAPYLWIAAISARQGDLAGAQAALSEYDKRDAGMTLTRLRQPGSTALRITDPVLEGLRKAGMKEQ
ncbi:MAG TPA: adenylate/guanylate cyclase domain-containing protein [Stellaceae bacterium]|nr:adenylate/guanylate cyclase domain-containing protein [Stellaceae bacterium]